MVLIWTEHMWTVIHEPSRQRTVVDSGLFCVKSFGFVSPTSLFKPNIAWFTAQILENPLEILLQSHPGRQIDQTEPDFPSQISSGVNRKCIRTAIIWADIQLSVLRIFRYPFQIFKYPGIFEYSKTRYRTCVHTWSAIFRYSVVSEPILSSHTSAVAYPYRTFPWRCFIFIQDNNTRTVSPVYWVRTIFSMQSTRLGRNIKLNCWR